MSALFAVAVAVRDLPDFGRIREIIERIQEILVFGGIALAAVGSALFLLAWVLSHLRKPKTQSTSQPWLSHVVYVASWVPVVLTSVAALGTMIPILAPYILQAFALAVLAAAVVWILAIVSLVAAGKQADLKRTRKALLMAGTPWYCLAVFLSKYLAFGFLLSP